MSTTVVCSSFGYIYLTVPIRWKWNFQKTINVITAITTTTTIAATTSSIARLRSHKGAE